MKFVAVIRQVPDGESKLRIQGDRVDLSGATMILDQMDEYAVEEAIRLKERHGGEAVVVGFGPERTEALRQQLGLGAGDAVLATEVSDYRRVGFTTKPGDAFAFNSFRVTFEVRATLTAQGGARTLFKDRVFIATTTLQNAGDPVAEELSVAPMLFADIASQIRQAATTAW